MFQGTNCNCSSFHVNNSKKRKDNSKYAFNFQTVNFSNYRVLVFFQALMRVLTKIFLIYPKIETHNTNVNFSNITTNGGRYFTRVHHFIVIAEFSFDLL